MITNLTQALERQKERTELMRKFMLWRIQHVNAKQEVCVQNKNEIKMKALNSKGSELLQFLLQFEEMTVFLFWYVWQCQITVWKHQFSNAAIGILSGIGKKSNLGLSYIVPITVINLQQITIVYISSFWSRCQGNLYVNFKRFMFE